MDKVKFEPVNYQRGKQPGYCAGDEQVCGIKYEISSKRWGIVPETTYPCDDQKAKENALNGARSRLESKANTFSGDYYDIKMLSVRAPARALREDGPDLVYARALGVEFDLESCVSWVSGELVESSEKAAALQCETFQTPGPAIKDYKDKLLRAADRAQGIATVAPAQTQ